MKVNPTYVYANMQRLMILWEQSEYQDKLDLAAIKNPDSKEALSIKNSIHVKKFLTRQITILMNGGSLRDIQL